MSSDLDKYHDKIDQIEGHVRALRMRLDAGQIARISEHARALAMGCWDLLEYTAEDVGITAYKAANLADGRDKRV
jgi:hypothetical protein